MYRNFSTPLCALSILVAILTWIACPLTSTAQTSDANAFHDIDNFHAPPLLPGTDWEALTGVKLSKKVANRVSLQMSYQTRFNDNVSKYKSSLLEVGGRYKLNRFVHFAGAYRFGLAGVRDWVGNLETIAHQNRVLVAGYFTLKRKKFPIQFQARLRYEKEWNSSLFREYSFVRVRAKVKGKITDWLGLYASVENFDGTGLPGLTQILRYETGARLGIGERSSLRTFFRQEAVDTGWITNRIRVVGVVWAHKLKG